jgi:hypothetical protein
VLHRVSSLWGNGAAVFIKYIVVKVLVFIKDYQAQVWGVVIFITLLAGFIPLLQVTFFALLEDLYPGRLAMKDRDKTHRIIGLILIMWYQITGLITASFCCWLFDLRIVLPRAIFRSDYLQLVSSPKSSDRIVCCRQSRRSFLSQVHVAADYSWVQAIHDLLQIECIPDSYIGSRQFFFPFQIDLVGLPESSAIYTLPGQIRSSYKKKETRSARGGHLALSDRPTPRSIPHGLVIAQPSQCGLAHLLERSLALALSVARPQTSSGVERDSLDRQLCTDIV